MIDTIFFFCSLNVTTLTVFDYFGMLGTIFHKVKEELKPTTSYSFPFEASKQTLRWPHDYCLLQFLSLCNSLLLSVGKT